VLRLRPWLIAVALLCDCDFDSVLIGISSIDYSTIAIQVEVTNMPAVPAT